jgi:hypothetical protein
MATDTKIILKRSNVIGAAPNSEYLEFGELAFNYRDEKLYYRTFRNGAEAITNYDFQRVIPIEKGGTGKTTIAEARAALEAAPLHDPSFTGIASLAAAAIQPGTTLDASDANSRRLATVGYVRAEIADDAPTKTGVGASGDNWNIGILRNAATASKWFAPISISQGTASDLNFTVNFDGSANVTTNLTINTNRRGVIQEALLLRPSTDIQAYDADLQAIASIADNSVGFLRKTAKDTWSLDPETYTPTSRTLTVTTQNGIEGGAAQTLANNRTWTLGLTTTGVTAGTYNNNSTQTNSFAVDVRGRITAVGAPVTITPHFDSITNTPTTLAGYRISDALNISAAAQTKAGNLTAANFIKTNGTSLQFLKADGSSDGTAYTPQARTLTFTTGNGITGGALVPVTLAADRSWTFGLTGQALNVHNLATNGFFVRDSPTTVAARSIAVGSGSGLAIASPDGVSGNPTISLATSNLTSLRDLSTTGFLTRTGLNTLSAKSIAVSGVGLSITNADGVNPGNPTLTLSSTSANVNNSLVARDSSGNFAANTITANTFSGSLSGSATTSVNSSVFSAAATNATYGIIFASDSGLSEMLWTDLTGLNYNPSTNTLTASTFSGNASTATTLATGRTISLTGDVTYTSPSFNGGGNVTAAATIANETVTGKFLTGLGVPILGEIHQTDSILHAFRKLQGNSNIKANTVNPIFSGTVTLPIGTSSAVPLILPPAGVLNTDTAAAGSIQFVSDSLSIVNSSLVRKTIAYTDSNITGNAATATSAGKWTSAKSISNTSNPGNSDIIFDVSLDGSVNVVPTLTINSARTSQIRSALGLAIGPNGIQAYDADLAAIAALADGDDDGSTVDTGYLRKTGDNTWIIDQNTVPPGAEELYTISGPDITGASGLASRNIVASLSPIAGLTAGTYNGGTSGTISAITPFTVDAKGRVTATGSAVTIAPAWGSITGKPTTLSESGILDAQALNSNLTSISTLGTTGSNGLLRRNAGNTWSFDTASYVPTSRALTITGAVNSGITVTPVGAQSVAVPQDLMADRGWLISLEAGNLTQLRDLGTNTGIIVHNGAAGGGMVTRSIASGNAAEITITNGNGVSGNPTISLTTSNLTSLRALTTNGFLAHTGTNTITPRSIVIASGSTGLSITDGNGVSGNPTITLSSTSSAVNNSLVARDSSGNFAANTITANTLTASTFNGGATLSGTPTAPTAAVSTNSTQIATTAFVIGQAADVAPPMDGIASAGSSTRFARADHVHATDTTRAPLASPTFTGTATAPTVSAGNYLVTGNSTTASGAAVQRVLSKSIPVGNIARLAEFTAAEGNVAIEIQVSSNTNSNSGTSTYIFQGGYLSLQATNPTTNSANFYRLYPFSDGRGHGEGTDTGLATTPWMIMIYQVQHSGSTGGYGVAIVNSSATVARSVVVTITELCRGMSFIDRSADSTVSFGTSAGNLYSHTHLLVGNRIGVGKVPTTALDVNGTIAATNLTLSGNLTVNGTTTTLNSNTISVDDKNIELGSVAAITGVTGTISGSGNVVNILSIPSTTGMIPGQILTRTGGTGSFGTNATITSVSTGAISITSTTANTEGAIVFDVGGATDVTASGGGITLKGTTDKTFNWNSSTGAWTSSEDLNLASGKVYEINGTSVLSATGLGSSVTSSSLTSVGTLTGGTWNGTIINPTYGGTGINNGTRTLTINTGNLTFTAQTAGSSVTVPSSGTLTVGADTHFIGTTSVALNRASGNLALTGISSVTLPGSTSGSVQIIPVAAAGTGTVLTLPATTGTVVTTGDTGSVTSTMILDGTIVNADISTTAAIAHNKLATLASGNILLGSSTNVPTATALTGDVTISNTGVTAIGSGVVVDADINASAAIAGTKISPDFGSQTIQTTGTASFGRTKFNRQDTATEGGEIVLGRAHNNDDAWIIDAANSLYAPDLRFFDVYSGLTRLLIKSTNGNVGIGTTNPSSTLDVNGTVTATTFLSNHTANTTKIYVGGFGIGKGTGIWCQRADSTNGTALTFHNESGLQRGSIVITSTGTNFNGTSDYRLKEDLQQIVSPLDKLNNLNPVNFKWIGSNDRTDGFIAHEVQSVVPNAVCGDKDAVDADGNPIYQQIDQSKLIPVLVGAIQELSRKVAELEAR